jgi:hypothetical protein
MKRQRPCWSGLLGFWDEPLGRITLTPAATNACSSSKDDSGVIKRVGMRESRSRKPKRGLERGWDANILITELREWRLRLSRCSLHGVPISDRATSTKE